MQGFKSKRGSEMVEASMVFPMMLLVLITLIFMMIYFYDQLDKRVDMHIMLRAECGEVCDNMIYYDRPDDSVPVYKKAQQLYSYGDVSFAEKWMISGNSKQIEARKYIIDEAKFVRMKNAVGDAVLENDE